MDSDQFALAQGFWAASSERLDPASGHLVRFASRSAGEYLRAPWLLHLDRLRLGQHQTPALTTTCFPVSLFLLAAGKPSANGAVEPAEGVNSKSTARGSAGTPPVPFRPSQRGLGGFERRDDAAADLPSLQARERWDIPSPAMGCIMGRSEQAVQDKWHFREQCFRVARIGVWIRRGLVRLVQSATRGLLHVQPSCLEQNLLKRARCRTASAPSAHARFLIDTTLGAARSADLQAAWAGDGFAALRFSPRVIGRNPLRALSPSTPQKGTRRWAQNGTDFKCDLAVVHDGLSVGV